MKMKLSNSLPGLLFKTCLPSSTARLTSQLKASARNKKNLSFARLDARSSQTKTRMKLTSPIILAALILSYNTTALSYDYNVLSHDDFNIYKAKLKEGIKKLRAYKSAILEQNEACDLQFTTGYRNKEGRYVLPLPIEDEPYFQLVGSDFERAQYYAGLGDALDFSEDLCDLAIFYWEKSITYSHKLSEKSYLDILTLLEWNHTNLTKKINNCQSQIGPTYEHIFEFNESAFSYLNKEGLEVKFILPQFFHEAHRPVTIGKKVFILGYNGKDYCLFVFNSETAEFLNWILIATELDLIDPFTIRYSRGFLYVTNNVVTNTINPLTLKVEKTVLSLQNIKNRNTPSNPFFSTSLILSPPSRGYATGEVAYLRSEDVLKPLLGILQKNATVSVLTSVLTLLQQKNMNDPEVHHALIKILSHESHYLILEPAISLLEKWKVQEAVKPLIALTHNERGRVARSACLALGTLKNPEAVPVLLEALFDPRPEVQTAAIGAFCLILHRDAIEPLMKLMQESTNEDVRRSAINALARFHRYYAAIPSYIEALNDPSSNIRHTVANALTEIFDIRVTEALLARLSVETNEGVKKAIR